jgi:hypothetical protein
MDTFVNGGGVTMETYYDEGQNVLWSQPASMSVEEATAALAEDPEEAMLDSISQWIVPYGLWLCDNNESADANCTSGTNYKWSGDDISLAGTSEHYAYFYARHLDCAYSSIERVYSVGMSSDTDYCDGGLYLGSYRTASSPPTWAPAEDDWCGSYYATHYYGLDDSSHITNRTYDTYDSEYVVRFRFWADSSWHYTIVYLQSCWE